MRKPLWTHVTVEKTEHATITTYHLTDEAHALLNVNSARLPVPPEPPPKRVIFIDCVPVPAKFRMLLGMTWVGWLNFCILQWFGLRLAYEPTSDGRIRVSRVFWAWPLDLWYWSRRAEIIVPVLVSMVFWASVAMMLARTL